MLAATNSTVQLMRSNGCNVTKFAKGGGKPIALRSARLRIRSAIVASLAASISNERSFLSQAQFCNNKVG